MMLTSSFSVRDLFGAYVLAYGRARMKALVEWDIWHAGPMHDYKMRNELALSHELHAFLEEWRVYTIGWPAGTALLDVLKADVLAREAYTAECERVLRDGNFKTLPPYAVLKDDAVWLRACEAKLEADHELTTFALWAHVVWTLLWAAQPICDRLAEEEERRWKSRAWLDGPEDDGPRYEGL